MAWEKIIWDGVGGGGKGQGVGPVWGSLTVCLWLHSNMQEVPNLLTHLSTVAVSRACRDACSPFSTRAGAGNQGVGDQYFANLTVRKGVALAHP